MLIVIIDESNGDRESRGRLLIVVVIKDGINGRGGQYYW